MIVTGYDDRQGCGFIVSTGPHAAEALPSGVEVHHNGVVVRATPELAALLRDALRNRPTTQLSWHGPRVPLALDDTTLLAWLTYEVGGVLSVRDGPRPRGPRPR
jgi:hypothetical protein